MEPTEPMTTEDEQLLHGQLAEAGERRSQLALDLRSIEDELDALADDRRQHQLLSQVCNGLEELEGVRGGALFWGEGAVPHQTHAVVEAARGRMQAFEKRRAEIEDRREIVLESIDGAELEIELLEDDLYEARREAENRRHEWIIEREVDGFPARLSVMPWMRGAEDDRRFRKALACTFLLSLLLAIALPMIDIPILDRWEQNEVPERLTRLLREHEPVPLPPPPVQREKPAEELIEPSEQQVAEEPTPSPTPTKKADAKPAPKGILAFREKFSGLADHKTASRLGAQARIRKAGAAATGSTQRSLVTTEGAGGSGGIDVASLSRDVGGGGTGIEGVEVGRATSSIGGAGTGVDRPLSNGPGPGRTDEEIQIVFDRHKAALYRLYNRELRRDPTLKGQMVLRIRIEPDGSVTSCEVQSSDMNAPQLSSQVVARVGKFDFGAKEGVAAITILYPIDFLPAT
jgi:outer membrane biosynthesis protein TonB